jgi:hypothetical protein
VSVFQSCPVTSSGTVVMAFRRPDSCSRITKLGLVTPGSTPAGRPTALRSGSVYQV